MSPQKAIIIILILFLVIVIVFSTFYIINKKATNQSIEQSTDNTSVVPTNQEGLSPTQQKIKEIETKTNQQVEQIVEQNKTATGGITIDAQRQIEDVINQEIAEINKLKTPEEKAAELKAQADRQKLEDQINSQIK
jgi:predicted PurR-regulated permease PerM